MKNKYWEHFLKTGNINFYLKYREEIAMLKDVKMGDNHAKKRGYCNKDNELQRK